MGLFGLSHTTTEHRFAAGRLSAYLDGELSSGERDRVERHVATCDRCRWELETLRSTVHWTAELPVVPVPRSFVVAVPARTAPIARRAWGLPVLQGATALVAVLFFLAVAGEALLPRLSTYQQPAPQPTAVALEAMPQAAAPVKVTVEVEKALQATAGPASADTLSTVTVAGAAPAATPSARQGYQAQLPASGSEVPLGLGAGEPASTPTSPPPSAYQAVVPEATASAEAQVGISGLATEPVTAQPTPRAQPTATAAPQPTAIAEAQTYSQTLAAPAGALAPTAESAALAGLQAPAPAAPESKQGIGARRNAAMGWLSGSVLALGLAFVLLGTLTVILTVRRLRRS